MARPPVAPKALLLSLLLWLVAAAPAGAAPVDAGKIVTAAELEPEPDPWEETGDEGEWEDVGEEEEDFEEEEEGGDETVDTPSGRRPRPRAGDEPGARPGAAVGRAWRAPRTRTGAPWS